MLASSSPDQAHQKVSSESASSQIKPLEEKQVNKSGDWKSTKDASEHVNGTGNKPQQTPTNNKPPTHRTPSTANKTPSRSSSANSHRESVGAAPATPDFDPCVSNYKLKTAAELAKESPKPGSAKKYQHVSSKLKDYIGTPPAKKTDAEAKATPTPQSNTPVRRASTSSAKSTPARDFNVCVSDYKPPSASELYKDSPKPGQSKKYEHVKPRVGSLANINHTPKGGNVKIVDEKLDFSNVTPKVGSLANINHTPKGGNVKIINEELDFSNVTPKVGSLANINHTPGGGKVKILNETPDFSKVESKLKDQIRKMSVSAKSGEVADDQKAESS